MKLPKLALSTDKLRRSAVDRQGGACPRCGELLGADVHLTVIRPIGKGGRIAPAYGKDPSQAIRSLSSAPEPLFA